MKKIRLTKKAAEALADILYWTLTNFGLHQAEKYKEELQGRIKTLAAGEPPAGRPLQSLLPNFPNDSSLFYYREGRHLIIYQDTPSIFIVTDLIHVARDIEQLLD